MDKDWVNQWVTQRGTTEQIATLPPETLIYDIGMGEFDHLQADNAKRPNGVPYASFGKLWKAIGRGHIRLLDNLMSSEQCDQIFEQFDYQLCQPIDLSDNTGSFSLLSVAISLCNYTGVPDQSFDAAVRFAKTVITGMLGKLIRNIHTDRELLANISENYPYSAVDRNVHDLSCLTATKCVAVIMPASLGAGWMVKSVNSDTGENRFLFPEYLWGKAKYPGIIFPPFKMKFCHQTGFCAMFDTKQDAVFCLEYLLDFPVPMQHST